MNTHKCHIYYFSAWESFGTNQAFPLNGKQQNHKPVVFLNWGYEVVEAISENIAQWRQYFIWYS